MPSPASFPRAARVRTPAEYARVFDGSRRCSSPVLSLHWLRDDMPPRLGLAVSRKVDRNAVGRNRIKRQLRDSFRQWRASLANGAYVVVARPPAKELPGPALRAEFSSLLRRAGALPTSGPPVTMPGCATSRLKLPEE